MEAVHNGPSPVVGAGAFPPAEEIGSTGDEGGASPSTVATSSTAQPTPIADALSTSFPGMQRPPLGINVDVDMRELRERQILSDFVRGEPAISRMFPGTEIPVKIVSDEALGTEQFWLKVALKNSPLLSNLKASNWINDYTTRMHWLRFKNLIPLLAAVIWGFSTGMMYLWISNQSRKDNGLNKKFDDVASGLLSIAGYISVADSTSLNMAIAARAGFLAFSRLSKVLYESFWLREAPLSNNWRYTLFMSIYMLIFAYFCLGNSQPVVLTAMTALALGAPMPFPKTEDLARYLMVIRGGLILMSASKVPSQLFPRLPEWTRMRMILTCQSRQSSQERLKLVELNNQAIDALKVLVKQKDLVYLYGVFDAMRRARNTLVNSRNDSTANSEFFKEYGRLVEIVKTRAEDLTTGRVLSPAKLEQASSTPRRGGRSFGVNTIIEKSGFSALWDRISWLLRPSGLFLLFGFAMTCASLYAYGLEPKTENGLATNMPELFSNGTALTEGTAKAGMVANLLFSADYCLTGLMAMMNALLSANLGQIGLSVIMVLIVLPTLLAGKGILSNSSGEPLPIYQQIFGIAASGLMNVQAGYDIANCIVACCRRCGVPDSRYYTEEFCDEMGEFLINAWTQLGNDFAAVYRYTGDQIQEIAKIVFADQQSDDTEPAVSVLNTEDVSLENTGTDSKESEAALLTLEQRVAAGSTTRQVPKVSTAFREAFDAFTQDEGAWVSVFVYDFNAPTQTMSVNSPDRRYSAGSDYSGMGMGDGPAVRMRPMLSPVATARRHAATDIGQRLEHGQAR